MEFSKQEYWGRLPFPSPGDLLDPGAELESPALQVDFFTICAIINILEEIKEEIAVMKQREKFLRRSK